MGRRQLAGVSTFNTHPPYEQSTPRLTTSVYPSGQAPMHRPRKPIGDAPGLKTYGGTLDPTKRTTLARTSGTQTHRSARVHTEESRTPLLKARERNEETTKHYAEVTPSASATEPRHRTNRTTKQTQTTRQHQHRDQPHQRHAPRADELQETPQASDPRYPIKYICSLHTQSGEIIRTYASEPRTGRDGQRERQERLKLDGP